MAPSSFSIPPKVTPRTLRTIPQTYLPAGWRLVLGAAEHLNSVGREQERVVVCKREAVAPGRR